MDTVTDFLIKVALLAPPILFALTFHEAAHGVVAYLRGDDTALRAGRISLNPLRHLDLAGTLVFFVTAFMGAGIGWAKPVPVNHMRFKDPHRDLIWVSAAGPAVNLLLALLVGLVLHLLIVLGVFRAGPEGWSTFQQYVGRLFLLGVQVNVVFAFINLIPLPPLDGSGIVTGLLPPRVAVDYQRLGRYGIMVLLALIVLPGWVPWFPDVIGYLVLGPAQMVTAMILP